MSGPFGVNPFASKAGEKRTVLGTLPKNTRAKASSLTPHRPISKLSFAQVVSASKPACNPKPKEISQDETLFVDNPVQTVIKEESIQGPLPISPKSNSKVELNPCKTDETKLTVEQRLACNEVVMENILYLCDHQDQARCLRVNKLFFHIAGPMVYRQFHFFNDYVWRQERAYTLTTPASSSTYNMKDMFLKMGYGEETGIAPKRHFQRHLLTHVKVLKDSIHDECGYYRSRIARLSKIETLQISVNSPERGASLDCPWITSCPILFLRPRKLVLRNLLPQNINMALKKYKPMISRVEILSFVILLSNEMCTLGPELANAIHRDNKVVRLIFAEHQTAPDDYPIGKPPSRARVIQFLTTFLTGTRTINPPKIEIYFLQYHPSEGSSVDNFRNAAFSNIAEIYLPVWNALKLNFLKQFKQDVIPDIAFKTAKEYAADDVDDELDLGELDKMRIEPLDKRHRFVIQRERLPLAYRI